MDNIPFLYLETSLNNEVLSMNVHLSADLKTEVLNKPVSEIFDVWHAKQGGKLIQARLNNKGYIFLKEQFTDYGIIYVGITSQELENKSSELQELQRINRHLDAVIENSYDGIYITNKDGVTLRTNSAIERITGIPKEYYLNKKVDDLIKRGILEDSVTHKVMEKKRSVSLVQLNYSGKETLLTGNPVFNEQGEVESVVTNVRDLSDLNGLQIALRKANELNESYQKEIERLKRSESFIDGKTVVENEQMRIIYDTAKRIANVSATVLILGETGVGKDVLAKYIYNESERRRSGKFIKVNCGAIPSHLLESELFGYAGGAFTGASKNGKPGMFELADKGFLFLDEIGEMPLDLQVKLLRVIQEREIQRVGGTSTKKVDVRLLAATNRNLKEMVQEGKFREDLYYRLNVVPIVIPPLRERKEEIHELIKLFLKDINEKYGMKKELNAELISFFYRHNWPGNIRELSNLLEQIVLLNSVDRLELEHLPAEYKMESNAQPIVVNETMTLKTAVEAAEENLLKQAAEKYTTTYDLAKALDTSQPTIVRKLKKYNVRLKGRDRNL
ncbi:sigma-54-dependent Fis family transcriptional regulator [Sporosarcina sp. JAI121]|uniref:sigma-54 interaction domain-containing protein n=1 Tax=Sporosarcina sp. JAI121 TaxID=2723064 RepID=UPI0015C6EABF|nr:sigma 54-interacting transcriptional regulator [Sporosarcina sp. JAI121]